nr:MAG: semaphorin-1A-like protein [Marsupenaeus japonicus endogenous nimavirus]
MLTFQYFGTTLLFITVCVAVNKNNNDNIYNMASTNNIVLLKRIKIQTFSGNNSITTDYFKVLERGGQSLLIGGRNIVYNLSVKNMKENTSQRIVWYPTEMDINTCFLKGKHKEYCQNYIQVLIKIDKNRFLVCGTNAYNPLCRYYIQEDDGTFIFTETNKGTGQCPFDPRQNSTHVYVDGELYSGTVTDFQGTTHVISKNRLTTQAATYEQLNAPNFVHSFGYGDFIYFFFRETAIEFMNCGKKVYSRVARVCKSDQGDQKSQTKWTSFLKSRLNCSVPGEFPFYFDEIHSVTNTITGVYGGQIHNIIYAVFTTPPNSIPGSAVCAFSIRSIQDTFDGDFKEQETKNSNWLPMSQDKIPKIRPGSCIPKNQSVSDRFIGFMQSHTLMNTAVPGFFGRPFISTLRYHFTKIAVDPQVKLQDGRVIDVIFLGTTLSIIKVVNILSYENVHIVEPIIIEEIRVFPRPMTITNLYLVKENSKRKRLVIVTFKHIKSINIHRCHRAKSCQSCVGLRDPYCGWYANQEKCAPLNFDTREYIFQNISGYYNQCHNHKNDANIINNHKNDANIINNHENFSSQYNISTKKISTKKLSTKKLSVNKYYNSSEENVNNLKSENTTKSNIETEPIGTFLTTRATTKSDDSHILFSRSIGTVNTTILKFNDGPVETVTTPELKANFVEMATVNAITKLTVSSVENVTEEKLDKGPVETVATPGSEDDPVELATVKTIPKLNVNPIVNATEEKLDKGPVETVATPGSEDDPVELATVKTIPKLNVNPIVNATEEKLDKGPVETVATPGSEDDPVELATVKTIPKLNVNPIVNATEEKLDKGPVETVATPGSEDDPVELATVKTIPKLNVNPIVNATEEKLDKGPVETVATPGSEDDPVELATVKTIPKITVSPIENVTTGFDDIHIEKITTKATPESDDNPIETVTTTEFGSNSVEKVTSESSESNKDGKNKYVEKETSESNKDRKNKTHNNDCSICTTKRLFFGIIIGIGIGLLTIGVIIGYILSQKLYTPKNIIYENDFL